MKDNNLKKNGIFKTLIFIGLIILITIGYKKDIIKFPQKNQENIVIAKEDLGVPIEIEEVKEEDLIKKISYTGTLYPKETVELSFKMPGEIVELNIKEGDYIKKGEIIASLDSVSIEAKLNTIEAKIDTIKVNLDYLKVEEERHRDLLEGGIIPQSLYDKINHEKNLAEMQLRELEATRNELSVNLQDTILISPIDGIVKIINSSIGETVPMGKPIVIIDYYKDATIKVNVSEYDLKNIKVGTPVILDIPGVQESIKSKVTRIIPNINPATRIGEVEIQDINSPEGFIFGSSIPTEFILEELKNIITISEKSIKQLKEGPVVYRLKGEYVEETPIEIGTKANQRAQIIEGLEVDDKIATKNIDKLYDGAKVYLKDIDNGEGEIEQ